MKLVERHLVKQSKAIYKEIDKLSFLSKNLYNSATYICRQAFFGNSELPSFNQLYHQLKNSIDYKSLPSKVSQLVIKQVARSFQSFFAALAAYKEDSSKFLSKPKLPKYKHKTEGRNLLCYNYQAISKKVLKHGDFQEVKRLPANWLNHFNNRYEITKVAFSPDSNYIALVSDEEQIYLWDISLLKAEDNNWQSLLKIACDRLRYHPVFQNPETDLEKQACEICHKWVWEK